MDVREILAALDPDDKVLWERARNAMRKIYMSTHNQTVGIDKWEPKDDSRLDMIDIMIAQLFDRGHRFETTKQLINNPKEIEQAIIEEAPKPFGAPGTNGTHPPIDPNDKEQSEATRLLNGIKEEADKEAMERSHPWNSK